MEEESKIVSILENILLFFVVADFVSKTGFPDKIKLQEIGPDGSVFEVSQSKIDCYRVMGIFLE
ncbi:Uncharacterized protein GNX_0032 [Leptospira interrogans serovar Canicola]|nr:Uncharacterized protein A9P81_4229 [Leptospira interrogans serovar Copenhageni/Icterohaemorrhagiae]OCC31391.1 Uncharacterized protein GNX_0032 [Leptospira interrogans serovar Canicola]